MNDTLLRALIALQGRDPFLHVLPLAEFHAALVDAAPAGAKIPSAGRLMAEIAAGQSRLRAAGVKVGQGYKDFAPVCYVANATTPIAEILPVPELTDGGEIVNLSLVDGTSLTVEMQQAGAGRGFLIEQRDANDEAMFRRDDWGENAPGLLLPEPVLRELLPRLQKYLDQ